MNTIIYLGFYLDGVAKCLTGPQFFYVGEKRAPGQSMKKVSFQLSLAYSYVIEEYFYFP